MHGSELKTVGLFARLGLAVVAGSVIVWAFAWFALRPWRQAGDLRGRIELTVLHWGDREEDEIAQSLVDSFEAANPHIRVNRINGGADYFTKFKTMVASGDPPDVVFLNAYHIPTYVHKGVLKELEPFIRADTGAGTLGFDLSDMYPEALDSFRFDGKEPERGPLYGLPMSFTPLGFYYNKTLFDRAGVPYPADDWTWEDFERTATTLGERLDDAYGCAFDLRGGGTVRLMCWTYGTDLLTPTLDALRYTEPAVQAVLETVRRWSEKSPAFKLFGARVRTVEQPDSVFLAGRAAMYGPVGRWQVPVFRSIADFEWDYARLPRGTTRADMLYVAAWCICKGSDHPEEAWRLARHLATPEAQRINSGLGLALPTLRSVAESPSFTNPDMPPSRDDLYLAQIPGARAMHFPAESKFTIFLRDALESCIATRKQTIDQAMAEVERRWSQEQASPVRRRDYPPMPWKAIGSAVAGVLVLVVGIGGAVWYRRRPGRRAFREELSGLAMASPWMVGFCAFVLGPMGIAFLLAFTNWSGMATLDQAQWLGLANFRHMLFYDDRLMRALEVTAYYAALAVPLGQCVALGMAMVIANPVRGIGFFRSAWYLPTVLAGVAMAVMWLWVFDADVGLLNGLLTPVLRPLGLEPPAWLGDDAAVWGVPAFVIASLWTLGGTMLIYLAGLTNIPKTLHEAAEIDGAGWGRRFLNVTVPMLSPVILFNFVIAIIGSFQVFTQAWVMTKGGPKDATLFYVVYLYEEAFEHHEMGYASAMAWLLFLVILVLTLVTLRFSARRVHYEGLRS